MRFDLISLLTIVASFIVLIELKGNWSQFWDDKVTLEDKLLASKLAFFVLVPLGVLLHEIGHSLATWQVGGTVKTFRWFGFSGYIIPVGNFSLAEHWWISFAGNLVSILLGLVAIPLVFWVRKRIVAETLFAFAFVQLLYALIGYPLYSLVTQSGDWVTIYDSLFKPFIYLLFVVHIILIYQLWQLSHSKKTLYWRLSRQPQIFSTFEKLQGEQIIRPQDLQPQLDLAYFLVSNQEDYAAKQIIRKIERSDPQNLQLRVLKLVVIFYAAKYRQVIKQGKKLLNEDLPLEDNLRLYRLLCFSYLSTRDYSQALVYADQGLELAPQDWKLRHSRADIYIQLANYSAATTDLDIALTNCSDQEMQAFMKRKQKHCRQKLSERSD